MKQEIKKLSTETIKEFIEVIETKLSNKGKKAIEEDYNELKKELNKRLDK